MKKSNIENWVKYFAGTLAVSAMLVVGSCDNNTTDQQKTDYENEVEAAENEIGSPIRDNASRDIDAESYENTEDTSGQPARAAGQEANKTNTTGNQRQQEQQDSTSQQNGNPERTEGNTLNDQN